MKSLARLHASTFILFLALLPVAATLACAPIKFTTSGLSNAEGAASVDTSASSPPSVIVSYPPATVDPNPVKTPPAASPQPVQPPLSGNPADPVIKPPVNPSTQPVSDVVSCGNELQLPLTFALGTVQLNGLTGAQLISAEKISQLSNISGNLTVTAD